MLYLIKRGDGLLVLELLGPPELRGPLRFLARQPSALGGPRRAIVLDRILLEVKPLCLELVGHLIDQEGLLD